MIGTKEQNSDFEKPALRSISNNGIGGKGQHKGCGEESRSEGTGPTVTTVAAVTQGVTTAATLTRRSAVNYQQPAVTESLKTPPAYLISETSTVVQTTSVVKEVTEEEIEDSDKASKSLADP